MGYVYPAVVSLAPPKLEDVGTAKAGEIVQGSPVAKGSSCRHFLAMDPMCISGDRGEWVSEAGGTSCRLTCKYRLTATPVRQLASDSSATVPCYMGMTDGTGTPNCESTGASQSGPFLVSPAR